MPSSRAFNLSFLGISANSSGSMSLILSDLRELNLGMLAIISPFKKRSMDKAAILPSATAWIAVAGPTLKSPPANTLSFQCMVSSSDSAVLHLDNGNACSTVFRSSSCQATSIFCEIAAMIESNCSI